MRYFLGLDLPSGSKLAIEEWRNKALPWNANNVPPANFHITTVFLGQVQPATLDTLCQQIDTLTGKAFNLELNMLGYWSKPKILWLGTDTVPQQLARLQQDLTRCAKNANIPIQNRPYVPHVTLVRKSSSNPPAPTVPPSFTCTFNAFHLFESVSGKHGVRYPIRRTWDLI